MSSKSTHEESNSTVRASHFRKSRSNRNGSLLANVQLTSYEKQQSGLASKVALGAISIIAVAVTAVFIVNSGVPTAKLVVSEPTAAVVELRSFAQFVEDQGATETASAYEEMIAIIDAGETPSKDLYVAAAQELLLKSDGDEAKVVMQMARVAYPEDADIYLTELSVKAGTGAAEEVWLELAQSGQTSHPTIMGMLIDIAALSAKTDETLVLLGDLDNLGWEPSSDQWNQILDLLVATGQIDKAIDLADEKLNTTQPDGTGGSSSEVDYTDKFEALREFERGDYKDALRKQLAYLSAIDNPTPADYDMLARIYLARGNTAKADEAYEVAEGIKNADAIDLSRGGRGRDRDDDDD